MTTANQTFQTLHQFLQDNLSSKNSGTPTHTRIGSKEHNIYGGSYNIIEEQLPQFNMLYYDYNINQSKSEYLTEKQSGKCIAIDFDFKYPAGTTERQHTVEDIDNIVSLYTNELKEILILDETPFQIFVMEKDNVNQLVDKTKDGIHILINVKLEHAVQEILRENILPKIAKKLQHLPLINTWEQILDEGITKGTTNWQLYGSKKPAHEAYKVTVVYEAQLDSSINQIVLSNKDIFELSSDTFYQLTVQNPNNPQFELNPKIIMRYNDKIKNQIPTQQHSPEQSPEQTISTTNKELLKILYFMDNGFDKEITKIKDHLTFTRIGYALHNAFKEEGLPLYLRLAEQYSSNYNEAEYTQKYNNSISKCKNTTLGTLYHLFKQYNLPLYKELNAKYQIQNNPELDNALEDSIKSQKEYDIALVLKLMFGNTNKCVDIKKRIWYEFNQQTGCWREDHSLNIRNHISTKLIGLYVNKLTECNIRITQLKCPDKDTEERKELDFLKKKCKMICILIDKCKTTNDKNNILRELSEIVCDPELIKKFDNKDYLFAFNNCVFDLKTGEKIQPKYDDYILTTTGYDYEDNYDPNLVEELQQLINSILPNKEIQNYYLTMLSTGLSGIQIQHFFIATGSGGNGKSIISSLMLNGTGDYGYKLSSNFIQNKLKGSETSNVELASLNKKRFVIVSEPDTDKKVCSSTVKSLTGDESLNGRTMYSVINQILLKLTFLLECNTIPLMSEVILAVVRRTRAIPFTTDAIEQAEFDEKTEEEKQSGKYNVKNLHYISPEFRNKYKQALIMILMKKFVEFIERGDMPPFPEECKSKTTNYLSSSDDMYSWVNEYYEKVPIELLGTEQDLPISISTLYDEFKCSETYINMNKNDKRIYTKKYFTEQIETNTFLRKSYKQRDNRYNGIKLKSPSLIGWRQKTEETEIIEE